MALYVNAGKIGRMSPSYNHEVVEHLRTHGERTTIHTLLL